MGDTEDCEFRWDVEVPFAEKQYGDKFIRQWRKILKQQRLAALGSKIPPRKARYQICMNAETRTSDLASKQAELEKAIAKLRSGDGESIAPESPETHPLEWQGVRVWMTFERDDVENTLGKKPV